ncbi:LacI family transcriptional regulator [Verrucomicrobium sp. GAS474]|uniref:LacI family DNA-binding transcriptional regulator n=1 Tax=Verrucomicrobium sp. GAS474 TaxID=1882831 RepID=UPI00087AE2E0|nr:GntR family transcriptional regulator [Verrucomicrobium sp. GAS474]SDU11611.1 LacI family transcriptional regulator [Verrucomicrobium sp. GAS474]
MASSSSSRPSTASKTAAAWDKLFQSVSIDRGSSHSLHAQLRTALRQIILRGLKDGDLFMPELEIVRRLGLSQGTVRRALSELAGEGLLERRRAIGTLVRHPAAAGLKHLALVAADFNALYTGTIIGHFQMECQKRGVTLRILRLGPTDDSQTVERNLAFPPDEGAVAFLALPDAVVRSMTQILGDRGYRTLVIDRNMENYAGSQVGLCNRSAVEMGMDRLTKLGHRRIAFLVGEPEESEAVQERCRLFTAEARKRGLREARVFHCGIHAWENGAEAVVRAMPELWSGGEPPTAVFAISDVCALGALSWLQQQGVRLPEEVSLLSFDGTQLTGYSHPKISTLVQPFEEYAERALDILSDPRAVSKNLSLSPAYREGGTTAPLARPRKTAKSAGRGAVEKA